MCIKTFQMSYQRPLSALSHSDPNPVCLDTPEFHYLSVLWVAPIISRQVSKLNKKLLYNTNLRSIHTNLNGFFQLKLSHRVYYVFFYWKKNKNNKKPFYNASVTILQKNTKSLIQSFRAMFYPNYSVILKQTRFNISFTPQENCLMLV